MARLKITYKDLEECPVWQEWYDEAFATHTSTEEGFDHARQYINELYQRVMGVPEPRFVLRARSPIGARFLGKYLQKYTSNKNYRKSNMVDRLKDEEVKIMSQYFTLYPSTCNPRDLYPASWMEAFDMVGLETFRYFTEQCERLGYPTRGIPVNVRIFPKFKDFLTKPALIHHFFQRAYPWHLMDTVNLISFSRSSLKGTLRDYLREVNNYCDTLDAGLAQMGDGLVSHYIHNQPSFYTE